MARIKIYVLNHLRRLYFWLHGIYRDEHEKRDKILP